jgi:hypothetical protein
LGNGADSNAYVINFFQHNECKTTPVRIFNQEMISVHTKYRSDLVSRGVGTADNPGYGEAIMSSWGNVP